MAKKIDTSEYNRFSDVTDRLDEIIDSVRDKNTSLERSLDLFDEAIALGTRAVDLVDKAAFSPEERERLVDAGDAEDGDAEAAGDAASADVAEQAEAPSAEASAKTAAEDSADVSEAE